MKLRRIVAATSAAAIAACAVAATASANFANFYTEGTDNQQFACLASNDWHGVMLNDAADLDDVTGFKLTLSIENHKDYKSDKGDGFWFGGAIGANSPSTGWKNLATWGHEGGTEEVIWEEIDKGVWTVTYQASAPVFAASDSYAFFWIQDYSELKDAYEYKMVDLVLMDANGNDVNAADAPATEAPEVKDEPVVEETEEIVVEETEEIAVEETEEIFVEETEEIVVDEPVEDEPVVDEPVADEPAVDTEAPTTGDKQSPDTGVEGIAAVAGVVALAGAAVVASRKRK